MKALQNVCGKDALQKPTIYRWFDNFKRGGINVALKHSPERPKEATAPENVAKIKDLLKTDKKIYLRGKSQRSR